VGDVGAEGEFQGNFIFWKGGNSSLPSSESRFRAVFSLGTAMVLRRALLPPPEGRVLSMAVASSIEVGIQSIAVGGSGCLSVTLHVLSSRYETKQDEDDVGTVELAALDWCPKLQQRRSRAFVYSTSMAKQRWLNEGGLTTLQYCTLLRVPTNIDCASHSLSDGFTWSFAHSFARPFARPFSRPLSRPFTQPRPTAYPNQSP